VQLRDEGTAERLPLRPATAARPRRRASAQRGDGAAQRVGRADGAANATEDSLLRGIAVTTRSTGSRVR